MAVERRAGYDSIVVSNAFAAKGQRIFQYISRDPNGNEFLHTLSFPRTGDGADLTVSDSYALESSSTGFRGHARRVALRCRLRASATARLLDTSKSLE
jgi:hypothetical protein